MKDLVGWVKFRNEEFNKLRHLKIPFFAFQIFMFPRKGNLLEVLSM